MLIGVGRLPPTEMSVAMGYFSVVLFELNQAPFSEGGGQWYYRIPSSTSNVEFEGVHWLKENRVTDYIIDSRNPFANSKTIVVFINNFGFN